LHNYDIMMVHAVSTLPLEDLEITGDFRRASHPGNIYLSATLDSVVTKPN